MQQLVLIAMQVSLLCATCAAADGRAAAEATDDEDAISEITVSAERVANMQPAGTFAAPVTSLRFDPLVEIQSRGLAEGQSDVAVRGGVFENTGFKVGAVNIFDPQTGHYVAELPIDPALLGPPQIEQGTDNALAGFNSAVATVAYALSVIDDGGLVHLGAGSDSLDFQSFRYARTTAGADGASLGAALSVARSAGDGSVANGDHRFSRYNLNVQRTSEDAQTDVLFAFQDKFFGWPGAYTGFATLNEIDDTQTTLVLTNHRRETASGWWEAGGAYRRLIDDYDFDRTTAESGGPGSFEHETRSVAVGLRGLHRSGRVAWRYGGQATSDELVRSTDLTGGDFSDRRYLTLTVVPSIDVGLAAGTLTLAAGATLDYSNRDRDVLLPQFGLTLSRPGATGETTISLDYSATSQLPGYTALKSNPVGLFGGNPGLGRERARQLALGLARSRGDWQGRLTVFGRKDDDLVDWTFESGAPFARQANAVDLDVLGIETYVSREWSGALLSAGYTYLDKDADYGSAVVDASYYALNFARHRATVALRYRFSERVELRIDNEYRRQEKNPLRSGSDSAYRASVSLIWQSRRVDGLDFTLIVDNVTDSDFQPFPGTPAAGRQLSASVAYGW